MLGFFGVGLLGAALSAGVRRAGLLIAILVLPFYAPFVIFGAAAAMEAANGVPFPPALSMLAGCALFAAVLGPIGAAAAARLQTE
jgi:heme exporter protein B